MYKQTIDNQHLVMNESWQGWDYDRLSDKYESDDAKLNECTYTNPKDSKTNHNAKTEQQERYRCNISILFT